MKNKAAAKITGYSIIIMALLAAFAFGYAYPKICDLTDKSLTLTSLRENEILYILMVSSIILILIIDFLISYTLYIYFKGIDIFFSLMACALRLSYSIIFGFAIFFLIKNLSLTTYINDLIFYNFQQFEIIWSLGLIFFGVHLFIVGLLMILHSDIPSILWVVTFIGSLSYMVVHFMKIISIDSQFSFSLESILALPMALAEIGLAIWLILKGGNGDNINKYIVLGL